MAIMEQRSRVRMIDSVGGGEPPELQIARHLQWYVAARGSPSSSRTLCFRIQGMSGAMEKD